MSFALNVGFGVLGGLTPLVALYLIRREANDLSPAYLLMVAAAVSLLTVLFLPETVSLPWAEACLPEWVGSNSQR